MQLAVNKVNLLFDFCLIVLSEAFPNMDFVQRVPQSRIYWLSLWIQEEQRRDNFRHTTVFLYSLIKRHNFVLENVERKDGVKNYHLHPMALSTPLLNGHLQDH